MFSTFAVCTHSCSSWSNVRKKLILLFQSVENAMQADGHNVDSNATHSFDTGYDSTSEDISTADLLIMNASFDGKWYGEIKFICHMHST